MLDRSRTLFHGVVWVIGLSLAIGSLSSGWAMDPSLDDTTSTSVGRASNISPNIVWIIIEDMSANFSCYGETTIQTPHIDGLSASGVRFTKAFVTAPICSISRSALITGCYQTSLGVQNHRSSVPGHTIQLPSDVTLVTELFHDHGYHVNNLTWEAFLKNDAQLDKSDRVEVAKTDYNFEWNTEKSYDKTHWARRDRGKPFFVQIQLHGGKFRGQVPKPEWPNRVLKELGSITEASSVKLPAYLPEDPVIREDWAQYLDCVRYTDHQVGTIVQRLKETGDFANTIIFVMTDHGISHVRNKQFLYDGGTHVPLLVSGPGIAAGITREDLVEHIDLGATSLGFAGLPIPQSMHSRDLFGPDYQERQAVFAARDRADETVDWIRSVRTEKYKYIRNGFPSRPYLQPNLYKDSKAIVQAMRRLYADGKLDPSQSLIMAENRPLEELYELSSDPNEFRNLAHNPEYAAVLSEMRGKLIQWCQQTGDRAGPESAEVYELEAAAEHLEGGKGNRTPQYQNNLELMRRWRTEKPFVPLLTGASQP